MGLPRHVVAAYSLIGFGLASTLVMIGLYVPRLYAEHFGVSLSQLAVLLPLMQIWDAATDLPLGMLSDRSKSDKGRRRPFVLVGSLMLAVAVVGVFVPPRNLSMTGLVAYVSPILAVVFLSSTVVRVPWLAWGADLTSDYNQKTVVSAAREFVWLAGTLAGAVAPAAIGVGVAGTFQPLLCAAIIWACVIAVTGVVAYIYVPDPKPTCVSQTRSETNSTLSEFIIHFCRNRNALALFAAQVIMTVGFAVSFCLYPFYVPYVLEVEETSLFSGLYIIAGAFGVPFAQWLSQRTEKKPVLIGGSVAQALAFTIVFFLAVDNGDVAVYMACLFLAGFAFTGLWMVHLSAMGDIADVQQLIAGGLRDEAKIYSLFDITRKLTASAGTAISFAVVDQAGYDPHMKPQSENTKMAIRVCYSLVPAVLFWVAALIIGLFYSMNREAHAEVLARLAVLQKDIPSEAPEKIEGPRKLSKLAMLQGGVPVEQPNEIEGGQSFPNLAALKQDGPVEAPKQGEPVVASEDIQGDQKFATSAVSEFAL